MKLNNKNEKFSYVKAGIMAFSVIAAVILFFFIVFKIDSILSFLGKLLHILQPIIFGAVIAFLINPICKFLCKNIKIFMNRIFKKSNSFSKFSKYTSISLSLLFFVLIISVFFYMVIPEFARTVSNLISVLPEQIRSFSAWVVKVMENNSSISNAINHLMGSLSNWFQTNFVEDATRYATYLATGVIDIVNFVIDFLIGIIVAFYILSSKQSLKLQFKKILFGILNKKFALNTINLLHKSVNIFNGFINGKLINALIIGVLCFIGCSVMGIPYVMLISVVIAVTDMIPVFGPYIGAVPSALLILLNSPIKCLYFVIFIILLQIFDGNVIGPKILGESTGLSAFWVMFAILLGGGLFGILGMLIGVPVFAVIYYIFKTLINYLLTRKNLPTKSISYASAVSVNPINEQGEDDEEKSIDKAK